MSVVMEHHIAELPFYSFWRDSSIGSAQSLIDGQAAVFLHDWNAFCRLFVRTGKHRCQTDHTDNQAVDGQYSYFGLPIVHTAETVKIFAGNAALLPGEESEEK